MSSELATSDTGTLLRNLSNSIKWSQSDGKIQIELQQEASSDVTSEEIDNSQQTCSSTASDGDASASAVPESVVQYQRQLRKVQANQKSSRTLTMKDHFKLIYEDEHLVVVDKPCGVLCVPGLNHKPNLLDLIRTQHLCLGTDKDPSKMIVHRLDMDTSGVVVFAKTETAMKALQAKFRNRSPDLVKEYHALLCGHLPEAWDEDIHIRLPLQRDHGHPPFMRVATPLSEEKARLAVKDLRTHGFRKLVKKRPKPSHTEMKIVSKEWLESANSGGRDTEKLPVTRVVLIPHSGRTHQLRVHCAALGYPIVGDPAYGLYGEASFRGGLDNDKNDTILGASLDLQKKLQEAWPLAEKQMCLHAAKLGMKHPITVQDIVWEAKTPF
jgi:23S rRNA-/tRNA-specific pseudouridylate synthase